MCRYVQDLPLLFKILSDNDQRLQLQEKVNFRNVKVYYIEEFPRYTEFSSSSDQKAVRKLSLIFKKETTKASACGTNSSRICSALQTTPCLPSITEWWIDERRAVSTTSVWINSRNSRESSMRFLREDAIVLVPTHPEPPSPSDDHPHVSQHRIHWHIQYSRISLNADSCRIEQRSSFRYQAVSAPLKDRLTLAAAVELDKVFGGWVSPCSIDV
ncbi:fatty-acid amide hydrolase 2 [Caerostris extrusa]|uniref:Fatty-acid amide hydrolase 2 n=1 Tax=Caerostris extrusa TaxID=172846 RepID=A0AAV4XYQ7_CAEEX|nr:fatty-acid amide hydrolase 2 [Caerostris extrusa]